MGKGAKESSGENPKEELLSAVCGASEVISPGGRIEEEASMIARGIDAVLGRGSGRGGQREIVNPEKKPFWPGDKKNSFP